jgi:hypothetical protein
MIATILNALTLMETITETSQKRISGGQQNRALLVAIPGKPVLHIAMCLIGPGVPCAVPAFHTFLPVELTATA